MNQDLFGRTLFVSSLFGVVVPCMLLLVKSLTLI
jgi:hypothetical protein